MLKEPSMYNVIMHNDDITTMDFVVMILQKVFRKTEEDAVALMQKVHFEGRGVAGTYYKDIADSKAKYAMRMARERQFPFLLTVEEA